MAYTKSEGCLHNIANGIFCGAYSSTDILRIRDVPDPNAAFTAISTQVAYKVSGLISTGRGTGHQDEMSSSATGHPDCNRLSETSESANYQVGPFFVKGKFLALDL